MMTIPLSRFFKTNWLNFHRNQFSKLTKNYYETKIIGDSIAAGLSRYQNVWVKFMQHLRAFNCGNVVVLIIFLLSKALKSSCFMWYKQFESGFA